MATFHCEVCNASFLKSNKTFHLSSKRHTGNLSAQPVNDTAETLELISKLPVKILMESLARKLTDKSKTKTEEELLQFKQLFILTYSQLNGL